jgi:hypothetical protein
MQFKRPNKIKKKIKEQKKPLRIKIKVFVMWIHNEIGHIKWLIPLFLYVYFSSRNWSILIFE